MDTRIFALKSMLCIIMDPGFSLLCIYRMLTEQHVDMKTIERLLEIFQQLDHQSSYDVKYCKSCRVYGRLVLKLCTENQTILIRKFLPSHAQTITSYLNNRIASEEQRYSCKIVTIPDLRQLGLRERSNPGRAVMELSSCFLRLHMSCRLHHVLEHLSGDVIYGLYCCRSQAAHGSNFKEDG